MTEIEAGIRLTAKNDTSRAFSEFERQGRKSTSVVAQQFELVNRQMKATGVALSAVGVAGAALITKTTLLAARVETLGVVMNQVGKQAGFSEQQMAQFEKGVRDMGITTQVARSSLIRLIQANIDLSKSSQLARLAQDAAVIAGINSSEAFERMVHGINTLNPRVLKTMGLVISLEQAYANYAKQMGITTNEIDVNTKKQIAVNEVLQAGERIAGSYEAAMDTAGKRMTSIARHAEEAAKSFGEAFLPVFVTVIDATTAAFKAFNSLNPELQKLIAFSTAAGTAIAGMIGPLLILASQGPKIVGGMSAVGSVFFSLGPNIAALGTGAGFLTTKLALLPPAIGALGVAAAAATALIALAVALGAVAKFAIEFNQNVQNVRKSLEQHEQAVFENADSYTEYRREMLRTAEVINDNSFFTQQLVLTQKEWNAMSEQTQRRLQSQNRVVLIASEGQFRTARATREASDQFEDQRRIMMLHRENLADTIQTTEELAAVLEEQLTRELEDLSFVMGVDVSRAFEEHTDRMDDLRLKQSDLIEGIRELEGRRWLTLAQKEQVAEMRGELNKVNQAIVAESQAWERNTAQIIFNMAQRALSQAPLEVQAAALGELALELGLVDEAGARAFTQITEWSQMLADKQITLEEYIALVNGLRDGLNELHSKTIDVELRYRVSGSPGGATPGALFSATEVAAGAGTLTTSGGAVGGQFGGFLPFGLGKPIVLGEVGEEMLLPVKGGYIVLPTNVTRRMMRGGVRPTDKLQTGGLLIEGLFGSVEAAQSTTSFRRMMAREAGTRRREEQDIRLGRGQPAPTATGPAATATQVQTQVTAVAQTIASETTQAIGAMAAGLGSEILGLNRMQTEQMRALLRDAQLTSEQVRMLLEDIKFVLQQQGTSDDMARSVTEGLQTADLS